MRFLLVFLTATLIASPALAQERSFRLKAEATRPSVSEATRFEASAESSLQDLPAEPPTWKGALTDSLRLLMIEHATRIAFQSKTREELGGSFLGDYLRSVKVPDAWEDGDSWLVNYVGHPIHGAASGFVWLDHEDGAHDPALGFSKAYWGSRARATAWAAGYSYQFEFGPLSEASIGNVGLRPGTSGWVDHVVTPVGALAIMVAEDTLDRYLIRRIESWTPNRVLRGFARTLLNPSRTLSNTAKGRLPWFRAVRPLSGSRTAQVREDDR